MTDELALTSTAGTCTALTASGAPCRAHAGSSGLCFTHDPQYAAQRAAGRSAGGRARHGRVIANDNAGGPVSLATLADACSLLARAVNDTLQLENSLGRARCIGYLAVVWGKLYETSELEARIRALEARAVGG